MYMNVSLSSPIISPHSVHCKFWARLLSQSIALSTCDVCKRKPSGNQTWLSMIFPSKPPSMWFPDIPPYFPYSFPMIHDFTKFFIQWHFPAMLPKDLLAGSRHKLHRTWHSLRHRWTPAPWLRWSGPEGQKICRAYACYQWEFQDPKCGDIPLHSPYIGLIYGRYLQFRFLKWPLMLPSGNLLHSYWSHGP